MITIGVDEAGRGPLVGNVVAAAVLLGKLSEVDLVKLDDSKKLTERQRECLYEKIIATSDYAIGEATPKEIDELNIHHATLLAMRRAINKLLINQQYRQVHIIIDGKYIPKESDIENKSTMIQMEAIIQADSLVYSVSAASIIAKVTRDRQMYELHQRHPQYDFAKHKGYPTKKHKQAIFDYGVLAEHRQSYRGVKMDKVN